MTDKQHYKITLNSWKKQPTIEGTGKNKIQFREHNGGAVRWGTYTTDEQAKQAARESWKEHFPDTMKEIIIFNNSAERIFEHNNFKDYELQNKA